ncbi:hypothetical protein C0J52_00818, partial [Blattella germanica]
KVSVNISREPGGVSRFRRLLPQIIASVACNFVLLDLNSCLGYPTVIIAQLRETQEIPLSSIAYICQPFGSLSSGFLVEWLGRRRFMMLLNIPFLTGWLLMCFAPSFPVLVLASVIIGITIGLTEAPINSYIGEVCQPEIRGMMTACAGVFYQCGFFVEYLLGSLTTWRNTAGISAAIPIFTAIYIFLVPEAPIWLVSKGRIEEAESALCWLRGWVEPSVVKEELTELVRYHEETKKLLGSPSTKTQVGFSNPAFVEENRTDGKTTPTVANAESQDVNTQSWGGEMKDRLRDLIRPPTLRPLMLVIPFFFFVHFSGLTSIRPFMVEVVSGGCGVVGTVLMMFTVHILGKRPLSLFCTAGSAFSAILLGVYALAAGAPHKEGGESLSLTWMPLLLFIVLSFCNSIVGQMPWMLLSEVFPFRTRGLSGGVSAAGCYVFLFLSSKTYLDVERSFSLAGGFLFYGAISCVGAVFLYFRLLETEGKSLEDIEQHFTQGRSARDAK